jgi:4-diphosphocytidyl-2-C-methyl-D-erythritol kinase
MIVFPNCKINLGLRIHRKRSDGFHDIETVFYPVRLTDALEIIPAANETLLTTSGIAVEGNTADNSCSKAYQLLKKDFPLLPPIAIHLHKAIPTGAGLGGGSADGAFALKLINQQFQLGLTENQLLDYALQLGSDCPFFIINKPCIATGRGELLTPLSLDLSSYKIVIVNPGLHINTGWAFSQITPAIPGSSIETIIQQPVKDWKNTLINDFETPVFTNYPELQTIKNQLYNCGASYAAMSGSGSSIFGIYEEENPSLPSFPAHYFVKQC